MKHAVNSHDETAKSIILAIIIQLKLPHGTCFMSHMSWFFEGNELEYK
jgi:hypothetical protein